MRPATARPFTPAALAGAMLVAATLTLAPATAAQAQGAEGAAPAARPAGATQEARLALVIGNAAYLGEPLDNPVNDARLVAGALRRSGFAVDLRENLGRGALLNALREFGQKLSEHTVAVLYYAGHGLQLRDRNYLIPVDAEIRSEDEIPLHGIDLSFMLGRMSYARSRVNIVILDACRNNPFAGKTVPAQTGLAQMDAPVGTLLAFATAPGKVAADGVGSNGLYATYIAKHMATPGLPVELMFKRVREEVVRDTARQQVPWESSSLQGEFAFAPGGAAAPAVASVAALAPSPGVAVEAPAPASPAPVPAPVAAPIPAPAPPPVATPPAPAATVAIAAPSVAQASPSATAAASLAAARPELLPRVGDRWRYRVRDQFRLGDIEVTAGVDQVGVDGVVERWTSGTDAAPLRATVALAPAFQSVPGWTLTPPEYAPYLQAAGPWRAGQPTGSAERAIDSAVLPLRGTVEGEEEVQVVAGRFRALRVVLKGQAVWRGAGGGTVSSEQVVWYAPEVKRPVKTTVLTRIGGRVRESVTVELVEYQLH